MKRLFFTLLFLLAVLASALRADGIEKKTSLWKRVSDTLYPQSSTWSIDAYKYYMQGVELGSQDKIIWVDANSTVDETGSFNAPYTTITSAIATATSGDVVVVMPGSYSEHVTFPDDSISLVSLGGKEVTYLETVMTLNAGIDVADYSKIQGFTITGDAAGALIELAAAETNVTIIDNIINTTGSPTFGISGGAAGSDQLFVQKNIFRNDSGDGCIWLQKTNTNTIIDENFFYGADSTSGYAIQTAGINIAQFSNNYIEGFASGIFPHTVTSGTAGTYNVIIDGNVIKNCSKGIRLGHSSQTVNMDSIKVTNNTLYWNGIGLYIANAATNLVNTFDIIDNRFVGNTTNYANDHSSLVPLSLINFFDSEFRIGYGADQGAYALQVNGNGYFNGALTFSGATVAGNILPAVTNTYNLGSSSYIWNLIYGDSIYSSALADGIVPYSTNGWLTESPIYTNGTYTSFNTTTLDANLHVTSPANDVISIFERTNDDDATVKWSTPSKSWGWGIQDNSYFGVYNFDGTPGYKFIIAASTNYIGNLISPLANLHINGTSFFGTGSGAGLSGLTGDSAIAILSSSGVPRLYFFGPDSDDWYFSLNTSDQALAIGASGGYVFDNVILPSVTNASNLGSASYIWNLIYGDTVIANHFSGGTMSFTGASVSGNILPSVTNTYNLGSSSYIWNLIYGDTLIVNTFTDGTLYLTGGAITGLVSATDGTASWSSSSLSGFTSISGATLTDGTLSMNGGAITSLTSISDGTANWITNRLFGFTSVSADTITDGTLKSISGNVTGLVSATDGTASWSGSDLSGFLAIETDTLTVSDHLLRSVTAGITASTTQSQGQQPLTKDINEISTVGNANDVVTLPSAIAGMEIFIINNGANTLQIFPASSDNLGAGVDASTTLIAGATITFVSYDNTNWRVK